MKNYQCFLTKKILCNSYTKQDFLDFTQGDELNATQKKVASKMFSKSMPIDCLMVCKRT